MGWRLGKRRKRRNQSSSKTRVAEQERWISQCVLGKAGHCFALRIKLIALKRKRSTRKEKEKKKEKTTTDDYSEKEYEEAVNSNTKRHHRIHRLQFTNNAIPEIPDGDGNLPIILHQRSSMETAICR